MTHSHSRQWQPGDLVLHEDAPKTHAMLMQVLEVKDGKARTVLLKTKSQSERPGRRQSEGEWFRLDLLHDPAVFLKTEEFLQTLRERRQHQSADGHGAA